LAEIAELIEVIVEEAVFERDDDDDDDDDDDSTILIINVYCYIIIHRTLIYIINEYENNSRILYTNEDIIHSYSFIFIHLKMIFRDKKTGDLLNIRRDDYVNDRLYFQEIIRVSKSKNNHITPSPRCYPRSFHEVMSQTQHNNT